MAHINDIIDPGVLHAAIENRLVQVRVDPSSGLRIHNYTAQAQWQRAWDQATLSCRGLITDRNGTVLARPWPKFFNLEELDGFPDGEVEVTDKLDGSLGILYRGADGGLAIATRGSFASEQAIHATRVLRERYGSFEPTPGWTYLFEIIYPQNRIVVEYGFDDLVLLGGVENETGRSVARQALNPTWPGPCVEVLQHTSLAEALAAQDRAGVEGMVVHHLASDTRVKIKQAEYKRLHRLVTGLSEKMIWEILREGRSIEEILGAVPDEFYSWVQRVGGDLMRAHAETCAQVREHHEEILRDVHEKTDGTGRTIRKAYAERAVGHPHAGLLFALLDGKEIENPVWGRLEPAGTRTWRPGDLET